MAWPVAVLRVTGLTVMLFVVGVPLTAGVDTAEPSPLATALVLTVPVRVTAVVAPLTLPEGIVAGSVMAVAVELNVVGVPVTVMVTTVSLVRAAVPADRPAGSPLTAKLPAVIDDAYVPLVNV